MPSVPDALATYIEGLKTHDLAKIASTFADDIVFVTPVRTMVKGEILAFLRALYCGFPDWSYDHDPVECCNDGRYRVRWRQGGTHSATLELPDFDPVAATGKSVRIPAHYFYYRVEDDRLTEIRPDPVPGGAPRGIFEQIGVKVPPL